jgi:hypothetical protein
MLLEWLDLLEFIAIHIGSQSKKSKWAIEGHQVRDGSLVLVQLKRCNESTSLKITGVHIFCLTNCGPNIDEPLRVSRNQALAIDSEAKCSDFFLMLQGSFLPIFLLTLHLLRLVKAVAVDVLIVTGDVESGLRGIHHHLGD